jgi:hypothetical protein
MRRQRQQTTKSEFLKQGNAICAKGTRKIDRDGLAFFGCDSHGVTCGDEDERHRRNRAVFPNILETSRRQRCKIATA